MSNKFRILPLIVISLCAIGTVTYMYSQNTSDKTGSGNKTVNPSPFNDLLSEKIRTTILSADSVQWMLIDPWIDNDSVTAMFGQPLGEVLVSSPVVDSILINDVSELLLSPTSFQQDSITKESTFMPDFSIMFIGPTDSVLVSYSLYCDICRFQNTDELLDLNGESIRKDFIRNLRIVFPKDKFVRSISRQL